MSKTLLFYFAVSILSPVQAQTPEAAPLIPSGINAALGAVREGATVEDTVKAIRKFYPEAKMMEINQSSFGRGVICISLGGRVEVSFSVTDRTGNTDWRVDKVSRFGINDYNELKCITIESRPIKIEKLKTAEPAAADQPATQPAVKPPVKDQPSSPTSKDGPR